MKKLLLLSALLLTSCQPLSKLTTLLGIVTTSAEVVLSASGSLTPEQSAIVHTFISATASAVKLTATEMASGDTTFEKVTKIADAWQAALITPDALVKLPVNIQNLIKLVVQASQAVLQEIQAQLGAPAADRSKPVKLKLSYSDRRALADISKRADALIKK